MTIQEKIDRKLDKLQSLHNDALVGKLKSPKDLSDSDLVRFCINKINWLCEEDNSITQYQRDIALLQSAYWTRLNCEDFILKCKGFIFESLKMH